MSSTETARVLVVDDEESITELVATALRYEGFEVETAANGRAAVQLGASFRPDLVVLDVMLPDLDGFEVVPAAARRLGTRVPVLFLTARDATEDKVHGLTLGADDYVTKPFSLEELVARVRAVLRRTGARRGDGGRAARSPTSSWTRTRTRCAAAGRAIELSPTEFNLLRYLLVNAGRVLSQGADPRPRLAATTSAATSNVVETYISYLRRKIDTRGEPPLIHTVRGVGYALRLAAEPKSLRLRLTLRSASCRPRGGAGRVVAASAIATALRARLPGRPRRPAAADRRASVPRRSMSRAATRRRRAAAGAGALPRRLARRGRGHRRRRGLPHAATSTPRRTTPNLFTGDSGVDRGTRPSQDDYRMSSTPGLVARSSGAGDGTGTLVLAVPLHDVNCTLDRLRRDRAAGRRDRAGRRGACSRCWLVRRRAAAARADRGDGRRDRRRRPHPARAERATRAPRSAGWAALAQRDAHPDRAGVRRAASVRGAAAPVRRRRLARAADAADLDPRLRRAVPPRRGRAGRRTWR